MLTKETLINSLKAMPEEKFENIDLLLEHIVLLEKIEKAEADIAGGKIYTTAEAKEKLGKWLQSPGQKAP